MKQIEVVREAQGDEEDRLCRKAQSLMPPLGPERGGKLEVVALGLTLAWHLASGVVVWLSGTVLPQQSDPPDPSTSVYIDQFLLL